MKEGKCRLRVHPKSRELMKERVRTILTQQRKGRRLAQNSPQILYTWLGKLLQICRYAKLFTTDRLMVSTPVAHGHPETEEMHKDKISKLTKARYPQTKGVGTCEHPKRLPAYSQQSHSKLQHNRRTSDTVGICQFYRLLPQSITINLKNRRVPNGMHGGVRGWNGK
jgi:hypothetical protein